MGYDESMSETLPRQQPGRSSRRRLARLLAAVAGGLLLVWTLSGYLRLTLSARSPGGTAGGATTALERCSRSMPVDLAQACVAEMEKKEATARLRLWAGVTVGGVLLGLALWADRSARRPARNRRDA